MLDYIKIYPGTKDLVRRFPPADRCWLYEAVMDYAFGGQLPEWDADDLKWLVWELLKAKVDSAEAASIRGRNAGLASAAQRQQHAADVEQMLNRRSTDVQQPPNGSATPVQPNIDIDIDNDIDTDIDTDKGRKRTRNKTVAFDPPTVEDVRSYCREKGLQVDAERFVAYYTANGWKVGRNPMKDWRACCRTWVRSSYDKPRTAQTDYSQREYEETPVGEIPQWLADEIEQEEREKGEYLAAHGLPDTRENRERLVKTRGEWRMGA